MKRKLCTIIAVASALVSPFLSAFATSKTSAAEDDINFTLTAPAVVSEGETFRIIFQLESSGKGSASDFEWAGTEDFDIQWGPQKGTSSSVQIINGKTSRSSSTTYTYIALARKSGKFSLEAASAKFKGKTIKSNSMTIEVLPVSGSAQSPASTSSSSSSQVSASDNPQGATSDLFMRLTLTKTNVVVGESIDATLKLYQRTSLSGIENASFPSFEGFWSSETYAPTNIEFVRENYNGQAYDVAVIRRYRLIPQHEGTLTIDPAEMVVVVNTRRNSTSNSIFDDFFDTGYSQVRRRVRTEPVSVKVAALPSGAPDSFYGGVGTGFSVKSSLSSDSLTAHDAAVLSLQVQGTGNISLLQTPRPTFPIDVETFDSKSSETAGGKQYEYPFIPRSAGEFEIAPIEYTYYDTAKRQYVTLRTDPIPFTVAKGSGDNLTGTVNGLVSSRPSSEAVRTLSKDIRYISTSEPRLRRMDSMMVMSPLYIVLVMIIVLGSIAIGIVLSIVSSRRSDVASRRRSGASKKALGRLRTAKGYLDTGVHGAFYEELHRSLTDYICDKLGMTLSEFTKDNVTEAIVKRGASAETASLYVALLDICESERYSPSGSDSSQMRQHYEDALSIITALDSQMKTKSTHKMALVLLPLLFCHTLGAQQIDQLWAAGVSAYDSGDFESALSSFSEIYSSDLVSASLLCNIGSCYYRLGDEAHAVLFYERALRLDPGYEDAAYNLDVVREGLRDKIDSVPEFFLKSWWKSFCGIFVSNTWAWLSLVALALTCVSVLLFFLCKASLGWRKTGFFAAIPLLAVTIVCLLASLSGKRIAQDSTDAVVVSSVISVKNSPSDSSTSDLFILHEGTVVEICDRVGAFYKIKIADGRSGWLAVSSVEVI